MQVKETRHYQERASILVEDPDDDQNRNALHEAPESNPARTASFSRSFEKCCSLHGLQKPVV